MKNLVEISSLNVGLTPRFSPFSHKEEASYFSPAHAGDQSLLSGEIKTREVLKAVW